MAAAPHDPLCSDIGCQARPGRCGQKHHTMVPLPSCYWAESGFKWSKQPKMTALPSRMFWLCFCATRESAESSSIFINVNGLEGNISSIKFIAFKFHTHIFMVVKEVDEFFFFSGSITFFVLSWNLFIYWMYKKRKKKCSRYPDLPLLPPSRPKLNWLIHWEMWQTCYAHDSILLCPYC